MARIPGVVKERIMLLYESGMKVSDISKETGVNYQTVYAQTKMVDELKEKGYNSYTEYRNDLAKKKGYNSYTEYRNDLAKKQGYNSYTEYRKDLVKKQGYNSRTEYEKDLAEKRADNVKNKTLALLITGRLSDMGKSQKWLAEEIGVSRQMIFNYCHGLNLPSKEKAQEIANLLGLSYRTIDDLIVF